VVVVLLKKNIFFWGGGLPFDFTQASRTDDDHCWADIIYQIYKKKIQLTPGKKK